MASRVHIHYSSPPAPSSWRSIKLPKRRMPVPYSCPIRMSFFGIIAWTPPVLSTVSLLILLANLLRCKKLSRTNMGAHRASRKLPVLPATHTCFKPVCTTPYTVHSSSCRYSCSTDHCFHSLIHQLIGGHPC